MFDNQSKTTRSKCDHLNATPFGQERHRLETWHRARIVLVNDQNVDEKLRQRHPRFCNSNVNWSIANEQHVGQFGQTKRSLLLGPTIVRCPLERVPRVKIVAGYGSSVTKLVTTVTPNKGKARKVRWIVNRWKW